MNGFYSSRNQTANSYVLRSASKNNASRKLGVYSKFLNRTTTTNGLQQNDTIDSRISRVLHFHGDRRRDEGEVSMEEAPQRNNQSRDQTGVSMRDVRSPPRNFKPIRSSRMSPPRMSQTLRDSRMSPPRISRTLHDSRLSPPRNSETLRDAHMSPPRNSQALRDAHMSPPRNSQGLRDARMSPPRNSQALRDSRRSPPRNADIRERGFSRYVRSPPAAATNRDGETTVQFSGLSPVRNGLDTSKRDAPTIVRYTTPDGREVTVRTDSLHPSLSPRVVLKRYEPEYDENGRPIGLKRDEDGFLVPSAPSKKKTFIEEKRSTKKIVSDVSDSLPNVDAFYFIKRTEDKLSKKADRGFLGFGDPLITTDKKKEIVDWIQSTASQYEAPVAVPASVLNALPPQVLQEYAASVITNNQKAAQTSHHREETTKAVYTLKDWTIIKGRAPIELMVSGDLLDISSESLIEDGHVSSKILSADAVVVQTSCCIYHLSGTFQDPSNSIPTSVKKYFQGGKFPKEWKEVIRLWSILKDKEVSRQFSHSQASRTIYVEAERDDDIYRDRGGERTWARNDRGSPDITGARIRGKDDSRIREREDLRDISRNETRVRERGDVAEERVRQRESILLRERDLQDQRIRELEDLRLREKVAKKRELMDYRARQWEDRAREESCRIREHDDERYPERDIERIRGNSERERDIERIRVDNEREREVERAHDRVSYNDRGREHDIHRHQQPQTGIKRKSTTPLEEESMREEKKRRVTNKPEKRLATPAPARRNEKILTRSARRELNSLIMTPKSSKRGTLKSRRKTPGPVRRGRKLMYESMTSDVADVSDIL